ncbi:MAG TPA: bifunctional hydroxymethylpyrimidine kinase/phosphomethylpyrimidine kinase [Fredinandcohnia sp.]|nr:bifunctional hydroxymethylpyrimidine kinase/phosphomethylpyrimidine kinase [Fredinandcohnia sp.]
MSAFVPPVCLTIAGSDSSGGAGLQADLKTFEALGVYGASVVTLLTAQNTHGVTAVQLVSPELLRAQMHAVLSDLPVRAIKLGALGGTPVIRAVAEGLADWKGEDLVVDPVMVSKHGSRLLDAEAEALLGELLLPKARLLTPNRSEAAVLLGWSEGLREENARAAAEAIAERFSTAVVVTGGAGEGPEVVDWLVTSAGVERLAHPRVQGRHRHGAGCTLSAAIAAGLALGHGLVEAVVQARDFVVRAMRAAPTFGDGEGPLWHRAGVGPSDFGFTSSTR